MFARMCNLGSRARRKRGEIVGSAGKIEGGLQHRSICGRTHRPRLFAIFFGIFMSDWFVYLVRCQDGSLYAGVTTDVVRRLAAHNQGRGARYTRARRPVQLVFVDARLDRSDALRSEIAIKRMSAEQKRALVAAASFDMGGTSSASDPASPSDLVTETKREQTHAVREIQTLPRARRPRVGLPLCTKAASR